MRARRAAAVYLRDAAQYGARNGDWLCAVSPNLTSNAPRIASMRVNATTAAAAARARCPRTVPRRSTNRSPTAEKNESPLVMRCVNSIIVSSAGSAASRCRCRAANDRRSPRRIRLPAPGLPTESRRRKYTSTAHEKRRSAREGSCLCVHGSGSKRHRGRLRPSSVEQVRWAA